MFVYYFIRSVS